MYMVDRRRTAEWQTIRDGREARPEVRFVKDALCNAVESLRGAATTGFRRGLRLVRTVRKEGLSPRQRRAVLVASCALLACLAFCVFMAWLIASIATDPSGFSKLVEDNFVLAAVAYALVNTLQVFAAFIPGEPLELVAGYLFGAWGGLLVVSAGIAVGEVAVFVAVKRYGTRLVNMLVPQGKLDELSFFQDVRRLKVVTFLLMFIPGTPKDIVTYIVGLTPMNLATWVAISVPARILSILASTLAGAQAAGSNWGAAALIFILTCIVSVFGMAYYVAISRQARRAAAIERVARLEWEQGGRRTNDASSAAPEPSTPSDNTAPTHLRDLKRGSAALTGNHGA